MLLRPCVICTCTGAVIAMAFSLWFLIAAFTEYRAPDFQYASFSADMSKVTTCMETISRKTLEGKGWHKLAEEGGCDEGKRDALAAALRVSVHPLVYAWQKRTVRNANVSLALGFALPSIVMPPEQWSPTLNEKNGGAAHIRFQDKTTGWDDAIPQIHAERIYAALETLAGTDAVPSENGCRLTYPTGVYDEEYAIRVRAAYNSSGDTQVPVHDIATTCAGSNPPDEEWKTSSGGVDTRVVWGGLDGDYAAEGAADCPAGRSAAGFPTSARPATCASARRSATCCTRTACSSSASAAAARSRTPACPTSTWTRSRCSTFRTGSRAPRTRRPTTRRACGCSSAPSLATPSRFTR